LPARDTFELLSYVYDRDRARQAKRLAALVAAFRIEHLLDKPVRQLSLGERMRAEIVASLLHEPSVLFLDEPTIGLDAAAKAVVRDLLQEQSSSDGTTLLLTSHDAGDIERVCERAIVIAKGRVLWDGPLTELRRGYARTQRITLWTECETLELDLPGVKVLSRTPYCTELELERGAASLGAIVERAQRAGGVRDLSIEDAALDDVIRAFYASAGGEAAT
jgi:ABC-2 type transport system ATP-binding protein